MNFKAQASVGCKDGIFDAAYSFGGLGLASCTGSPEEIGQAVAHYLSQLTPKQCQAMEYGTSEFFIQLRIEPVKETS